MKPSFTPPSCFALSLLAWMLAGWPSLGQAQDQKPAARASRPAPAASAASVDRVELEPSRIVGHRELPKVLYLVAWKKPRPQTLGGRPAQSILGEPAQVLDREVQRRAIHYQSQSSAQAPTVPSAP